MRRLDGADDDGDGEVDEDVRFPAQQTAACRYTDDEKAAVEYGYENGERHVPLGLTVKQEAHTWSLPGFDRIAAVQYLRFPIDAEVRAALRTAGTELAVDIDHPAYPHGAPVPEPMRASLARDLDE